MNAVTDFSHAQNKRTPQFIHTVKLLLQREFWEHKGGFLWAPVGAGAISLLLTFMGLIMAEVGLRKVEGSALKVNGEIMINGLDIGALSSQMSAQDMQKFADGITAAIASAMIWPMLALGFVVFFYCLGALYDERKDRSVLFWKSLPISDRDTVVSKVISALLLAPAIAMAVGIVCMAAFMLLLSAFVLLHHGNPITLLWHPGKLFSSIGVFIAAIPVYALWALPSAGWLLLCSAWAKSKPFLWAIMLPVFAGVFVSWFDLMSTFNLGSGWFWKNVVAHLLGGVFPGTWVGAINAPDLEHIANSMTGSTLNHLDVLKAMYSAIRSPQLWVGATAGVAMITAAIRLRRWRDEG